MTIDELLKFRAREPQYRTVEALVRSLEVEQFRGEDVPEQCRDAISAFRKKNHKDRTRLAAKALGLPVPPQLPLPSVHAPIPVAAPVYAPTRIEDHFRRANQEISPAEAGFIRHMRESATAGVSFSLMLQVVEWEWQVRAPESARGPEHDRMLLKKQAKEIERLKFRCGEL
jgi:hypothetical protein